MIHRIDTGPRMSEAVVHGQTVYLAGQVADDTAADVRGQTEQVLASIDELLARVGSDKTKILQATVYLADIATFHHEAAEHGRFTELADNECSHFWNSGDFADAFLDRL